MALTLQLYPRAGATVLDEQGGTIPVTGGRYPADAYYSELMRRGDLLTTSPYAVPGVPLVFPPVTLGTVSVTQFGAVGDGITDDRPAFVAALATGKAVLVPAVETFYRIVGPLTINAGGLIGDECHANTGGIWSRLMFEQCTDSTIGAINVRQATWLGGSIRLENLYIEAANWTNTLGYGVDTECPVDMSNCYVTGFKRSGIWMHHNAGVVTGGPYQSHLVNVRCLANGGHGVFLGNGANNVTLINYEGKWNGAPSYLTQPTALNKGTGSGFYVNQSADGGTYSAYTPEGLVIIGGDCSYNADWGWNFQQLANSECSPGYCEGNLATGNKQVRWQYPIKTHIQLTQVAGNEAGCTDASSYQPYEWGSKVMLGGKQIWPATFRDRVLCPTASDFDVDGTSAINATNRVELLARSNHDTNFGASQQVYTTQNLDGEGNALDVDGPDADTALNFRVTPRGYVTIGGGTRYLKVSQTKVRLPDIFYWATGTGWSASEVTCQRHIARASVASGQSLADDPGTFTLVELSEDFDIGSNFNPTTNLFTAPITGYYAVSANIALGTTAGWLTLVLRDGANAVSFSEGSRVPGNLGGQARAELSDIVLMTAGQTLGLYGYQVSGSSRTLVSARLAIHYLWS